MLNVHCVVYLIVFISVALHAVTYATMYVPIILLKYNFIKPLIKKLYPGQEILLTPLTGTYLYPLRYMSTVHSQLPSSGCLLMSWKQHHLYMCP